MTPTPKRKEMNRKNGIKSEPPVSSEGSAVVAPIDRIGKAGLLVRHILLDLIYRSTAAVSGVQKWREPRLTRVMKFFTFLGLEDFFLPLILLLVWVVDARFGFLFNVLLGLGFYVTSFFKCLLCLPRPPLSLVKPVTTEDKDWAVPSNHSVIAVLMPWYIWDYVSTPSNGVSSWMLPLILCCLIIWTVGVNVSRIYLGVHSPVDVVCGTALGAALLVLYTKYDDALYQSFVSFPLTTAVLSAFCHATMLLLHPRTWPETQSYGETVITLSGALGMLASRALSLHKTPEPMSLLQRHPDISSWQTFYLTIARFLVGAVSLLLYRVVGKSVVRWAARAGAAQLGWGSYSFSQTAKSHPQPVKHFTPAYRLPSLAPSPPAAMPQPATDPRLPPAFADYSWLPYDHRPLDTDIPVRLCVYFGMGFMVLDLCPWLFALCGI